MAGRKLNRHSNSTKDLRMRQQLALEAARLIAEEGIKDFHAAKHKAALRLHAPHTHNLPRNDEIKLALNQYQRLFKADTQPRQLFKLRQTSLKAMVFFKQFEPRLAGPVLDGSANEFSDINIHLFADSSEEISIFLINERVPYEIGSQPITMTNGEVIERPTYLVTLDDAQLELTIFDCKGLRQPPCCPVSGKPMQRININRVDELLRLSSY